MNLRISDPGPAAATTAVRRFQPIVPGKSETAWLEPEPGPSLQVHKVTMKPGLPGTYEGQP